MRQMLVPGAVEIPVVDVERMTEFFATILPATVPATALPLAPVEGVTSGAYVRLRLAATTVGVAAGGATARVGEALRLALVGGEGLTVPLLVFSVHEETIDQALERVVSAGGEVEAGPRAVDDLGWFARFRDPEGNSFGLWQTFSPSPLAGRGGC